VAISLARLLFVLATTFCPWKPRKELILFEIMYPGPGMVVFVVVLMLIETMVIISMMVAHQEILAQKPIMGLKLSLKWKTEISGISYW